MSISQRAAEARRAIEESRRGIEAARTLKAMAPEVADRADKLIAIFERNIARNEAALVDIGPALPSDVDRCPAICPPPGLSEGQRCKFRANEPHTVHEAPDGTGWPDHMTRNRAK